LLHFHCALSIHTMTKYTVPCKGIVAYSQHEWKYEDLLTREPYEDEFLIEMIATGVCHTDISGYGGIYPRVLGHEGTIDIHTTLPSFLS
jgi:D-arabinose 1-dehydrogenase-like Zn-dependent alcohol dehydrogenase